MELRFWATSITTLFSFQWDSDERSDNISLASIAFFYQQVKGTFLHFTLLFGQCRGRALTFLEENDIKHLSLPRKSFLLLLQHQVGRHKFLPPVFLVDDYHFWNRTFAHLLWYLRPAGTSGMSRLNAVATALTTLTKITRKSSLATQMCQNSKLGV